MCGIGGGGGGGGVCLNLNIFLEAVLIKNNIFSKNGHLNRGPVYVTISFLDFQQNH